MVCVLGMVPEALSVTGPVKLVTVPLKGSCAVIVAPKGSPEDCGEPIGPNAK